MVIPQGKVYYLSWPRSWMGSRYVWFHRSHSYVYHGHLPVGKIKLKSEVCYKLVRRSRISCCYYYSKGLFSFQVMKTKHLGPMLRHLEQHKSQLLGWGTSPFQSFLSWWVLTRPTCSFHPLRSKVCNQVTTLETFYFFTLVPRVWHSENSKEWSQQLERSKDTFVRCCVWCFLFLPFPLNAERVQCD